MIIKKLMSKRGQISMELGILVAAAVAVAAIAAYYYLKSVENSAKKAKGSASNAISNLNNTASNYIQEIPSSPSSN